MSNITIAIDGFSSTGKSTVAKQLAKYLGYIYVDSGAMYRAVTLYAMQHDLIGEGFLKVEKLVSDLHNINISFKKNKETDGADVILNGKNVEKEIRTLEVSSFVSKIAAIPEVRYQMVKQQQTMGKSKGVVMDGRDIGTVVFPFAELKIFMTASPEIRAQRRFEELINRGEKVTFKEVLKNVRERDYIDSNRADSPLVKADDAIEVDNTSLNQEEQFGKILQLVEIALASKQ
jgi:cytidylate kinase